MKLINKIFILVATLITINIYSQEIETENWITDLNFLRSELSKKHKNLFFKITEQDFNKELNNIIENLDEDNDITTSIKLTQLFSKIGDAHTNLSTSHILKRRKTLPLGLKWFKDGLYVSGTSNDNYEILGKKILSINGYDLDIIIDSLKTLFVPENIGTINQHTIRLLSNNVLLKYFGFSKPNDSIYTLKLINTEGNITNYKLKEARSSIRTRRNNLYLKVDKEKPFFMNGSGKSFKEKYYPKEKIYFIQYNKCISKESVEKYGNKEYAYRYQSFNEFEAKVLKKIKKEKIDKLIFDMRFNQGGSSYLAENLISNICNNKKINKRGNLYVVVGNSTFSSAIINTINFKDNSEAIIIGEKTGGVPNHYGDVKSFKLPYSGITVRFSTEFYKLTEGNENTITPDVIIKQTYQDFKNGIDPIFEYVKNN